jgi:hypothetical protein
MKRKSNGLFSRVIAALLIAALFASCLPAIELTPELIGGDGRVTIRFGDDGTARTLMPSQPVLYAYDLQFSCISGGHNKVLLEKVSGASIDVPLGSGVWKVLALGYRYGVHAPVARVEKQFTVKSQSADAVNLVLAPIPWNEGGQGKLSWNIDISPLMGKTYTDLGDVLQQAKIMLSGEGGLYTEIILWEAEESGGENNDKPKQNPLQPERPDSETESKPVPVVPVKGFDPQTNIFSGSVDLAVGQYHAVVALTAPSGSMAAVDAAAHIYFELTTPFARVFTREEFAQVVPVKGRVAVSPPEGMTIADMRITGVKVRPISIKSGPVGEAVPVSGTGEFFLTIPYAERNNVYFKVMANIESADTTGANPLPLGLPSQTAPASGARSAAAAGSRKAPGADKIPWWVNLIVGIGVSGLAAMNLLYTHSFVDVTSSIRPDILTVEYGGGGSQVFGDIQYWGTGIDPLSGDYTWQLHTLPQSPLVGGGVPTIVYQPTYVYTFSGYIGGMIPVPSFGTSWWPEGQITPITIPVNFAVPLLGVESIDGYSFDEIMNGIAGTEDMPRSIEAVMDTPVGELPENGVSNMELVLGFHTVTYDFGADGPPVKLIVLNGSPIPKPPVWKPDSLATASWTWSVDTAPQGPASSQSIRPANAYGASAGAGTPPEWNFETDVVTENVVLIPEWTAPANVIRLNLEPGDPEWDSYIANAQGWSWRTQIPGIVSSIPVPGYLISRDDVVIVGYAGINGSSEKAIEINRDVDVYLYNAFIRVTPASASPITTGMAHPRLHLLGENDRYSFNIGNANYKTANALVSEWANSALYIQKDLDITAPESGKGKLFISGGSYTVRGNTTAGTITIQDNADIWVRGVYETALTSANVTIQNNANLQVDAVGCWKIDDGDKSGKRGDTGMFVSNTLTLRNQAKLSVSGANGGGSGEETGAVWGPLVKREPGSGGTGIYARNIHLIGNVELTARGGNGIQGSGGQGIVVVNNLTAGGTSLIKAYGGNGYAEVRDRSEIKGQGAMDVLKWDGGSGIFSFSSGSINLGSSRGIAKGGDKGDAWVFPYKGAAIYMGSSDPGSAILSLGFSYLEQLYRWGGYSGN